MVGATNGVKQSFLFTSESVGEGHPDKIAYVRTGDQARQRKLKYQPPRDQVSDAILDACLAEDPLSKVGRKAD